MQANLRCKLTREVEVRSYGYQFFKIFACNPDQQSKICPSVYQSCHVQEGEFGKNASIIVWNCILDGKPCVAKEIIENIDMENKTITYRVIDGDILNYYKTFLIHLHVTPKAGGISLSMWTIEYEKLNEDVPDANSFADAIVLVSKQVADYIGA